MLLQYYNSIFRFFKISIPYNNNTDPYNNNTESIILILNLYRYDAKTL